MDVKKMLEMIKWPFLSKLKKLKKLNLKSVNVILEFYKDADYEDLRDVRNDSYLYDNVIDLCSLDEKIMLLEHNIVSVNELLRRKQITVKDLFEKKYEINIDAIIKYGSDNDKIDKIEFILDYIAKNYIDFSMKIELSDNLSIGIFKQKYSDTVFVFYHLDNIYFINLSNVFSISLKDKKIYLNGVSSDFEIDIKKNVDTVFIDKVLRYLNNVAIQNNKELLENKNEKIFTQTQEEKWKNPWVAGALGFGLGCLLSSE